MNKLIIKSALELKRHFPLLFEMAKYAKDRISLHKRDKQAVHIHSLSVEALKAYNADLYKHYTGDVLDWENLRSYSEKMQYAKLFDHDPRKVVCADKYAVREWVKERIGEQYLIPIIDVYEKYSDIDFDTLPERFVIKTNHASGDAVLVKNKSRMTMAERLEMRRKIEIALKTDYGALLLEWHYSRITPPLIIVSEFINAGEKGLTDYKFFCFDGVPYCCQVETDRFGDRRVDIYDMDWTLMPWNQGYKTSGELMEKPANFEKMVEIVSILSAGFSHVRVDLFNVDGKIYFGEMSFTNESGFRKFAPESVNDTMGALWRLNMER